MVSIIKNQLLKHLSRFTKNLSADKINLSTFKGEGELSNLELNETVLTDLLELPSWLRLQSAWCNKVAFRIQWTQLKKVPIVLSLDEVNIIVETCEELRAMNLTAPVTAAVPGKYSFIHKIIDGITVTVNAVNITFNSPAFTANVQISRILLESKNPKWKKGDLRSTRIKEPEKGQLLIFKELEWQTMRIEAKSTVDKNLTPLRLLTNQARCRITIKKRLSDSFILGSRIVLILDDLLWVLTDSQLKAALHFLDSLVGLIQKDTAATRKTKAARKLEELPEYRAHQAQQEHLHNGNCSDAVKKSFTPWDVIETSYHFLSHQIVLHLCDDPGDGRSMYPSLKEGGALQITLQHFQVDFYPYHMAIIDRKHWPLYREAAIPHVMWQEQALSSFRSKFLDLIEKNRMQHTPLSRINKNVECPPIEARRTSISVPIQTDVKTFSIKQLNKLMTSCMIIRIEDFTVYKVTTSGKKQTLKEFITAQHKRKGGRGDRERMTLPPETKMVHAEFTYFYYPNDTPFPLPAPKFYVQVNPINIYFDLESCLWLNSFGLNLYQSLQDSKQDMGEMGNLTYIDVKIEVILPKLIFESYKDYIIQRDRPKSLTFEVTRATITNVRSLEQSSRADLAKCVDSFHMGSLFFGSEFPSTAKDFYIVTQKFLDHITTKDNIRHTPSELNANSVESLISQLSREFMWTEAKDVWCINLDPIWADFNGARALTKPVPLLDAVPLTIWLHCNMDPNSTIKEDKSYADIHALAHISNLVSVQLNHYQYLFLLRLAEDATELATFLLLDTKRITKLEQNSSLIVGALVPQVEITFVMPSAYPGKESSGGDMESFAPESSFADDALDQKGSMGTVWNSNLTIASVPPMQLTTNTNKCYTKSPTNDLSSFQTNSDKPIAQVHYQDKHSPNETSPMLGNEISKNPTLSNLTNAGFSSMRKGFSNLMTSIDSALKPTMDASDASDTMSIRSDQSSDSENFIFLNMDQEAMQKADDMFIVQEFMSQTKGIVEIASEVIEEESTITSTSEHSLTSSCRRKDLVSVSTFKLNKVEFIQQSIGYSSSIKLQVGSVSNEDCNSIPWDEFQGKFSSRSRAWSDNASNTITNTQFKLRMDHDILLPNNVHTINRSNVKSLFRDFIEIKVDDVALNLSMSTVVGLTDLVEDECIPIPIPMDISIRDIYLHLTEDRPPVNITSPGPVPIDVKIEELWITRDNEGVFHIIPNKNVTTTNNQSSHSIDDSILHQQLNRQLRLDNEELRRRLAAFERISEENRLLRKAKEETEVLKSSLSKSQEDVARLLDEKRRLLDEIRKMQEQFMNDRRSQWTAKR